MDGVHSEAFVEGSFIAFPFTIYLTLSEWSTNQATNQEQHGRHGKIHSKSEKSRYSLQYAV